MTRAWLALAACIALALTTGGVASANVTAGSGRAVTAAGQLPDGDGSPGFWWGTDSLPVTVPGSAPYSMPYLGGAYGGYIGMTGNWAYWLNCTGAEHFLAYSAADNTQAHTDYVTCHTASGRGVLVHGRPGVDPNYNGSTTEASAWDARQAARAFRHRERGRHRLPGRLDGRRGARHRARA